MCVLSIHCGVLFLSYLHDMWGIKNMPLTCDIECRFAVICANMHYREKDYNECRERLRWYEQWIIGF